MYLLMQTSYGIQSLWWHFIFESTVIAASFLFYLLLIVVVRAIKILHIEWTLIDEHMRIGIFIFKWNQYYSNHYGQIKLHISTPIVLEVLICWLAEMNQNFARDLSRKYCNWIVVFLHALTFQLAQRYSSLEIYWPITDSVTEHQGAPLL
jgi:hypothetical protein